MHQHVAQMAKQCSASSVLADRHEVLGALLDEGSLVLENCQCLLEPVDLGLASCLALSVCLCLGNALLLNLGEVFVHGSQLGLDVSLIGSELCVGLVEAVGLLGLVLDVLLLGGLLNLVLLGLLVVRGLGSLLSGVHLGQTLLEVGLAHFEQTD